MQVGYVCMYVHTRPTHRCTVSHRALTHYIATTDLPTCRPHKSIDHRVQRPFPSIISRERKNKKEKKNNNNNVLFPFSIDIKNALLKF